MIVAYRSTVASLLYATFKQATPPLSSLPLPLTLYSDGNVCRGNPNNVGGGASVNSSLRPLNVVELQNCIITDDPAPVRPLEYVWWGV